MAMLLTRPDGYSTIALNKHGPAIVNAGQSTFARTLYSRTQFEGIHTNFASIRTIDQFGILLDYWAFRQSGYAPVPDYLELARATPAGADPLVWMQIAGTLRQIDWLYPETAGRETFRKFARGLLQPVAARLGWEPQSNDDPNDTRLRSAVLQTLAQLGDSAVVAEARKRLDAALSDSGDMAPATRRAAVAIAAAHADALTVDRMMAKISATKDPLEKQNLLVALLREEDPEQTSRVLDFAIGPGAVAGFSPYTFSVAARAHPDLAWQRALQYFAKPNASVDPQMQLMLMPEIAEASSDPRPIDDLKAYAKEHIPASGRLFFGAAASAGTLLGAGGLQQVESEDDREQSQKFRPNAIPGALVRSPLSVSSFTICGLLPVGR